VVLLEGVPFGPRPAGRSKAQFATCKTTSVVAMAETVESYLGYHARFPGITSRTFARGRIDDSRSSYDALCDVACAALSAEPSGDVDLLAVEDA
jgi:hypothetical protein